jgi:hypothetical protein
METEVIDAAAARCLVEQGTVARTLIMSEAGGWTITLQAGVTDMILAVDGSGQPHVWKSLDQCVDFLQREIGLVRFELLDVAGHGENSTNGKLGNDAADESNQEVQSENTYEQWLKSEVQQELDDPRPSVSNDEVKRLFAERRNAMPSAGRDELGVLPAI